YLDDFGGYGHLLTNMRVYWQTLNQTETALGQLTNSLAEVEEKRDLFEFQRQEIEKVNPKENEDDELLAEKNRAKNNSRLTEALESSASILGSEPNNVVEKMALVRRNLEKCAQIDPKFEVALNLVEESYHQLADLAADLDRQSRETGVNHNRLEWIDERLNTLAKLKRKYGATLTEVMAKGREIAAKLEQLDNSELDLARLRRDHDKAYKQALEAAAELHSLRLKAGEQLAKKLTTSLRPLGFPKIEIEIKVNDLAKNRDQHLPLGPKGHNVVEFLFCPNPGEGLKPLAKIASGGELSRLMLALKTVTGEGSEQLLVFDEIDSGLGGVTAEAVATKMAQLATGQQVIVITHLPQMAALAGQHFLVAKHTDANLMRTTTTITPLKPDERTVELARMLGGANPSPEAHSLAHQLLKNAQQI
ncbi:MAG: DNA repair protein RecN, partial [Candidatus Adiutrix sp.]